jgi:ribosomal protein L7/L12
MNKDFKKLRDAVLKAGGRWARAQIELELAQRELDLAKKAVLDFDPSPRYDIHLNSKGSSHIEVIKAIREITGLTLKEAKEITDFASLGKDPRAVIARGVSYERGLKIKQAIEAAGGLAGGLVVGEKESCK